MDRSSGCYPGTWDLVSRLRAYFEHYNYSAKSIGVLAGGFFITMGIGLFLGWYAQDFFSDITLLFRHHLPLAQGSFSPAIIVISDLVFYPPIAFLILDSMRPLIVRRSR